MDSSILNKLMKSKIMDNCEDKIHIFYDQSSSQQFQLIDESTQDKSLQTDKQNENLPNSTKKQSIDDVIEVIEDIDMNQNQNNHVNPEKYKNQQSLKKQNSSLISLKYDEIYFLVQKKQIQQYFTHPNQWNQFFKSYEHRSNSQDKKSLKSIKIIELISVIRIKKNNEELRMQFWQKIAKNKSLPMVVDEIISQKNLKQITKSLMKLQNKITIVLKQIKPNNTPEQLQKQVKQWISVIKEVLIWYCIYDKQVSYSKGMQYICLGILISHPRSFYCQLREYFFSVLQNNLRQLYLPGNCRYYEEIVSINKQLSIQTSILYKYLLQMDLNQLFISYYKTALIYKCQNIEIIRKFFQLLLIYGIELIRIVLIKILIYHEKIIIQMFQMKQQKKIKEFITHMLINEYFKFCQNEEQICQKLLKLIVNQ